MLDQANKNLPNMLTGFKRKLRKRKVYAHLLLFNIIKLRFIIFISVD